MGDDLGCDGPLGDNSDPDADDVGVKLTEAGRFGLESITGFSFVPLYVFSLKINVL